MTEGIRTQREGPHVDPGPNPDLDKGGIGDRIPAFRDFWQRLWMFHENKSGQGDATHIIRRAEESVLPTPKYRMPYPVKNPVRHRDEKGA